MKRVQIKIQEEKEKEKKIYAKMFAWTISCVVLDDQYLMSTQSGKEKLQVFWGVTKELLEGPDHISVL